MSSQEKYYLHLTIPSDKKDSRLIGRAVYSVCIHAGFDEVQSYQLELATVEATHNIVEHAYSNCSDCMIEFHAQVLNDRIIFTMIDRGTPAVVTLPCNCPVCPEKGIDFLPESTGLFIINSVMDFVQYEAYEKSNILTMIKYLPKL